MNMTILLLIGMVAMVFACLWLTEWKRATECRMRNAKCRMRDRLKRYAREAWHARFMWGLQEALAMPAALWRGYKYRRDRVCLMANIAEGTHDGSVTLDADAAIVNAARPGGLLVKRGSSAARAAVCTAADTPIGATYDEAAAQGDKIAVQLFSSQQTLLLVASAAIAQDALVEPAAAGKVATLGAGVGTHHVVGRTLNAAAADGDLVEVVPSYFLRVI